MKEKISAVYKIVNEVTGDSYIGSSRDVKRRWAAHKCQSTWKNQPNNRMYKDMKTYGVDKFRFQILAPVMPEYLKQVEQELIEMLKPTYNNYNAKGLNVERHKEYQKEYRQSEKGKEAQKKYKQSEKGKEAQKKYKQSEKGKEAAKKYQQSEKGKKATKKYKQSEKGKEYQKEYQKKYFQSEKGKEVNKKAREKYQHSEKGKETRKKYQSQLCIYNGETLTLDTLRCRFKRMKIPHATMEAKKYLINTIQQSSEKSVKKFEKSCFKQGSQNEGYNKL